jgi:hypothetical protein
LFEISKGASVGGLFHCTKKPPSGSGGREAEVKGWKWVGDLRVQICIIAALIFAIWIVLQQQYY